MGRIELLGQGATTIAVIDGEEHEVEWFEENVFIVNVTDRTLEGRVGHDLPLGLRLRIKCPDDKGHPLFDVWLIGRTHNRLMVESWADGSPLTIRRVHFKWNPTHVAHNTLAYLMHNPWDDDVEVWVESMDDEPMLIVRQYKDLNTTLGDAFYAGTGWASMLMARVEANLTGKVWDSAYEIDEPLFTTALLIPLFKKMGFYNVRYRHGPREYGKDITFAELSAFGSMRHYGVQVKAGDIRGGVNSQVDEIIGQIEDAFSMPYYNIGSDDPCYISTFIIASSGRITENAKEKIAHRTRRALHGSVSFLDQELILELLERWWWGKGDLPSQ